MQTFIRISPNLLQPRIPELGKIKIGGKGELRRSDGGKQFRLPQKYDHFVVTTRMKDDSDNWVRDQVVHQKLGSKPKELDVRLMFDEPQENFQYFLAAYDGQTKRCSGDGQVAIDREHGEVPCTCPWLKVHDGPYTGPKRETGKKAPTCKPHGRLSVVLEAAETYGGFYVFRTTSWETIRSIAAQLDTFRGQFGFLAGLPLRMVIYPAKDVTPDGTFESYKVALVVRASMDTALQLATQAHERRALLPRGTMPEVHQAQLLEAEEREAKDIAEEFHSEVHGDDSDPGTSEDQEDPSDPESERLEWLCRRVLDLEGTDPQQINDAIAKRSDQMDGLAEYIAGKRPDLWSQAKREWEASQLTPEDLSQEDEEGVDAELEAVDAEAPVVDAELADDEPPPADELAALNLFGERT